MSTPLTFRRYAGSLQLDLSTFEALEAALEVPEALWIAMACPVEGLSCSRRLLDLMDLDQNGRIRVHELKQAVGFVASHLADRRGCTEASDTLELKRLSETGQALRPCAELLLELLDAPNRERISMSQFEQAMTRLKTLALFGEGILVPDTLPELELRAVATHLLTVLPGTPNSQGQRGVTVLTIQAWRDWHRQALAHQARQADAFTWGPQSLTLAHQLMAVRARVDEYFLQCRLVASQPDTAEHLRLEAQTIVDLMGDAPALSRAVASLPLAPPRTDGTLVLSLLHRGPSLEALQTVAKDLFLPVLGQAETLSEGDWKQLTEQADRILAWEQEGNRNPLLSTGTLLTLPAEQHEALAERCRYDSGCKERLDRRTELERLLVYQRWLLEFANNFISMPGLYHAEKPALFQLGTLILSGREFLLAVLVTNHAEHVRLASSNTLCVAYVKVISHLATVPEFEVAVPITSGSSAGIVPGRRGIFFRYDGQEFDAVVLEVVRNPVSPIEAMLQPFARVGQFISSKLEGLSSDGINSLDAQLAKGYQKATTLAVASVGTGQAALAGPIPAAPLAPALVAPTTAVVPPANTNLGTTLAGGGLAVAAVGSSVAFALGQLKQLTLVDVASTLLMLFVLVALPSGLVGYLKLRRRNLAVVLEGSGWALNDRLLVNRQLGSLLTRRPSIPPHARLLTLDEVTEKLRLRRLTGYEGDDDAAVRWWHVALMVLGLVAYLVWHFWGLIKDLLPLTTGSN